MSYIGKNPKVDSVKLDESATVPSGANAEGQLYFNSGTGSISRGLKVYKNSQFVAIDKQLGDADTFHLLKASDLATSEFSAARNSTSTSFLNQNAVPFETTTASGAAGTFSNSSTGDALLTDESADLVFAYKSSGSSDDAQEYFGIPLSVPKAFRGGNIVLTFEYRTGFGTGTTATVDGDFEVAVLDKSTGNGAQTTTTDTSGTAIAAGSNIAVASKTGFAVGQRIRLETGSSTIAAGSPDATVTEAFITSISTSTDHITISESYAPPSTSGGRITSGWLTDVVPGQLPTADSQTDKKGKKFSIQFKTEDDTSDIVLFFQNKNTSSTISRHLFVDNILLSANKFLQASSQLKSEYYFVPGSTVFWNDISSNSGWDVDLIQVGFGAPPVAQSKFLRFEETSSTETRVYARQDIDLQVGFSGTAQAGNQIKIYNSSNEIVAQQQTPDPAGHIQINNVNATFALAKDDYIYCVNDAGTTHPATRYGNANFLATGRNSDIIVLESQDEIFTDYVDYTPTITGHGTVSNLTAQYRRVGTNIEFFGSYTTGTVSTDLVSITLPPGLNISTSVAAISGGPQLGRFTSNETILNSRYLYFQPGETDKVYITEQSAARAPTTRLQGSQASTSTTICDFWGSIPIQGYNTNFNPLLSMPLVDFGTFSNTYAARFDGGATTSDSTRLLSESEPFVKTVVEDPGDGKYIITFLDGFFTQTPAVYACVENAENSDKVINVHSVTSSLCKVSIESSGDQNPSAANFNIIVTRQGSDFKPLPQPTAAVIKPAVALLKDVKAYNVAGGGSTAGAFNSRELNVIEGESYFVTLSGTGTKGIGGTNVEFTLDPGMYKMTAKVPFVGTNFSSARLYDVTNSQVVKYGSTEYTNISTDASGGSSVIEVVKTITSATQYKIQYRVSDGTGGNALGVEQNTDSTAVSVYTTVEIEKLK